MTDHRDRNLTILITLEADGYYNMCVLTCLRLLLLLFQEAFGA
jgi:hypothetical protein